MFSVLQSRCRSADSVLTEYDSGLDTLHYTHTPGTTTRQYDHHTPGATTSGRGHHELHESPSPNPHNRFHHKPTTTWMYANGASSDTDTGGKFYLDVRQRAASHQHLNGHKSSAFGLYGRGAAPVQPRMGVSGSLYNNRKATSRSAQLNSSELLNDDIENSESVQWHHSVKTRTHNTKNTKEHKSLNPLLPVASPAAAVINTSKTERPSARVERSSSTVENRKSRKETKTKDNTEIIVNTSGQQLRPCASQNQINLEQPYCSYNYNTERTRFTTQKSINPIPVTSAEMSKARNNSSKIVCNMQPASQMSRTNCTLRGQHDHFSDSNSRINGSSYLVTSTSINSPQDFVKLSTPCMSSYVHYFSNPELNVVERNQSDEEAHLLQLLKEKDAELAKIRRQLADKELVILQTKEKEYQTRSSERQAILEKRLSDLITASLRRDETFKRQLKLAQREINRLQAKLLFEISEKEMIEAKYCECENRKTKLERVFRDTNYTKRVSLAALDRVDADIQSPRLVTVNNSSTLNGNVKLRSEMSVANGTIQRYDERSKDNDNQYINKELQNESFTFSSSNIVCSSNKELVSNNANRNSLQVNNVNIHNQEGPQSSTMQPSRVYECESLTFPEVQPVYAKMESSSELIYYDLNSSTDVDSYVGNDNILYLSTHSIDGSTDLKNHYGDAVVLTPSPRQCMQIFNGSNTNIVIIQSDKNSNFVSSAISPTTAQTSIADEIIHLGVNSVIATEKDSSESQKLESVQINKLVEEVTKARNALEMCRREFDLERKGWLEEKSKVVNYHTRLEDQLVRVQKENKRFEDELSRLGRLEDK